MKTTAALHPTDQVLNAYGLGKLDDSTAQSVDAHLSGCAECRRRVAEISSDTFLGRLRAAEVQPPANGSAVSMTGGLSLLEAASTAPLPLPADSLPPGFADHPDYEVLRELGRGGMGVVYLARNRLMGRMEVLKVVGGHLVSKPAILERFLREIRSAARLHHPNIVTAYTTLRVGESLVLAMEYVDGLDLARVVKARGPLPVSKACNYVHQAALGLQHAHSHGMVHRDIKPSNLMLARDGKHAVVKVLDFGLAKVSSEDQRDNALTREGQMLGTPDYIAPEQIRDAQSADIRADIYSLGCTFYCLLSGKPPFVGQHPWDVYQAHFSMAANPLNLVRPEVPVELAALVAKMMAKEPERRFQEPREVAHALKPFFKSDAATSAVSRANVETPGRTTTDPLTSQAGTMPPRSSRSVNPPPIPKQPSQKTNSEPMWNSLIDLGESPSLHDSLLDKPCPPSLPAAKAAGSRQWWSASASLIRKVPGAWWTIIGVFLLCSLIAWSAGKILVKTPDGVIVLENLPEDAEVYVDGNRVTISWPTGGLPAEIFVPPGRRGVMVKMPGFSTFGQEVEIHAGERTGIRVRLEPAIASNEEKQGIAEDQTHAMGGMMRNMMQSMSPEDKTDTTEKGGGMGMGRLGGGMMGPMGGQPKADSEMGRMMREMMGRTSEQPKADSGMGPEKVPGTVDSHDEPLEEIGRISEGSWGADFSADNEKVVLPMTSWKFKVFALATARQVRVFRSGPPVVGKYCTVGSVVFGPDDKIVSSHSDEVIRVWDSNQEGEIQRLRPKPWPFGDVFTNLRYSSRGGWVVARNRDRPGVRIWDVKTAKEIRRYDFRSLSLDLFPNGKWLATLSDNHTINVWDASTGEVISQFRDPTGNLTNIKVSPAGGQLLGWSRNNARFYLFNSASGQILQEFVGHIANVRGATFFPNSPMIASVSTDNTLRLWTASTGRQTLLKQYPKQLNFVAISPNSQYLVLGMTDEVVFYRLHTVARQATRKRR